jgi:hypothetical protein
MALAILTQCETCWRAMLASLDKTYERLIADHPDAKKEMDLVRASVVQILLLFYYLFKLQMGFYPVAVYYNKTQHTNNHSTQNDTNNKGHTTHNDYNYNATNTIKTTIK